MRVREYLQQEPNLRTGAWRASALCLLSLRSVVSLGPHSARRGSPSPSSYISRLFLDETRFSLRLTTHAKNNNVSAIPTTSTPSRPPWRRRLQQATKSRPRSASAAGAAGI